MEEAFSSPSRARYSLVTSTMVFELVISNTYGEFNVGERTRDTDGEMHSKWIKYKADGTSKQYGY